jgi:hypothetical protein
MILENLRHSSATLLTGTTATMTTAALTTSMGVVSRLIENLPLIHDILGDISMMVGICACIALTRVHILRGNQISRGTKDRKNESSGDDNDAQ